MRVLLTGATGYIGSAVAEALLQAGHEVVGSVRSEASREKLSRMGATPLEADMMDPQPFGRAAAECDGVIHTASTGDANAGLIDGALVDLFLSALEGSGKPFLYTSGVWVMGNTGKDAGEETTPAPIAMVSWRVPVEHRVREAAGRDIRTVIIRPAMVYGRGGGLANLLLNWHPEAGAPVYFGDGENYWSLVHVDDLARLYLLALEQAPAGSLLVAANGAPMKTKDIAAAAAKAAGLKGGPLSLPIAEARNTLGPLLEGILMDQRVSAGKARELGWEPKAPSLAEEIEKGSYAKRREGRPPA